MTEITDQALGHGFQIIGNSNNNYGVYCFDSVLLLRDFVFMFSIRLYDAFLIIGIVKFLLDLRCHI